MIWRLSGTLSKQYIVPAGRQRTRESDPLCFMGRCPVLHCRDTSHGRSGMQETGSERVGRACRKNSNKLDYNPPFLQCVKAIRQNRQDRSRRGNDRPIPRTRLKIKSGEKAVIKIMLISLHSPSPRNTIKKYTPNQKRCRKEGHSISEVNRSCTT